MNILWPIICLVLTIFVLVVLFSIPGIGWLLSLIGVAILYEAVMKK